jgi:hypothetical protein
MGVVYEKQVQIMSDPQPNPPPVFNPPPVPGNNSFYKILWVLAAFIPTVFGIVCLQVKNIAEWWLSVFIVLNIICSIAAGVALGLGIEKGWLKILLSIFLVIAFFVLNGFIVLFIGCTEAVATNSF